ncbi:protein Turandot M-like [Drosophila serrata]|uniref:protein Turandot M-like n=1 Tax=Drosophila serrata TaxID=7274 RepID=UPI000A1D3167|nr:protein Turandot M-like [Drosophila serrata]
MSSTIFLSCLLVISGSLLGTANAEENFESDRERVIAVYKDANPDSIADSNVYFLVNFLDKYADQIQLTPEQRSQTEDVVKQYNEKRPSILWWTVHRLKAVGCQNLQGRSLSNWASHLLSRELKSYRILGLEIVVKLFVTY